MPPVIQVSSVRKTCGRTIAGDEESFEVNRDEIFGLNGAGVPHISPSKPEMSSTSQH
jgi:hypothetical protein